MRITIMYWPDHHHQVTNQVKFFKLKCLVTHSVLAYQTASVRVEIIIYAQLGLGTSGGKFLTGLSSKHKMKPSCPVEPAQVEV